MNEKIGDIKKELSLLNSADEYLKFINAYSGDERSGVKALVASAGKKYDAYIK